MRIPKAIKIVIAIALVVAIGAFLIGPKPDRQPAVTAADVGDAITIEVIDPVHQRPFDVSVWEPTGQDQTRLIIISHGFAGDRTSHDDLARGLAEQGYTVAAPTHPDMAGLESDDRRLDPLVLRPRHLSLTIDAMVDRAEVETEEVVVIGHSLGAYSALRLAGATPSTDVGITSYCADHGEDEVLCSGRAQSRFENLIAEPVDLSDDRIDRLVLLAPGYGPLFAEEDLDLSVSTLVIGATNDTLVGDQVDALVSALPDDTTYDKVDGGHYVFLRPCTDEEAASIPELCEEENGVDRSAIHAELVTTISE